MPLECRTWHFRFLQGFPDAVSPLHPSSHTRSKRWKLPIADTAAATAYLLQDQTLPGIIIDLLNAPGVWHSQLWLSVFVLSAPWALSPSSTCIVLRLPSLRSLRSGVPTDLAALELEKGMLILACTRLFSVSASKMLPTSSPSRCWNRQLSKVLCPNATHTDPGMSAMPQTA